MSPQQEEGSSAVWWEQDPLREDLGASGLVPMFHRAHRKLSQDREQPCASGSEAVMALLSWPPWGFGASLIANISTSFCSFLPHISFYLLHCRHVLADLVRDVTTWETQGCGCSRLICL